MSELKLTNEKMHTFDGHEKIGTFKAYGVRQQAE